MNEPAVVIAHARYRAYGGEDATAEAEARLLRERGHAVSELVLPPHDASGLRQQTPAIAGAVWSRSARRAVEAIVERDRPAVLHAHNIFPSLSPSIYRADVAVVQSVHNYRLVCPATTLFRDGHPCRECVGRRVAWPGVVHNCRGRRSETAVVAGVVAAWRGLGRGRDRVDLYLADSPFVRDALVDGGVAPDAIAVVPPVVEVFEGPAARFERPTVVFAGRLVVEKGTAALAEVATRLRDVLDVVVVGDGPERDALARAGAIVLGHRQRDEVHRLMRGAMVVVVPSVWDEPFGLVAAEAMGCGVPVVAARVGGLATIVDDGVNGWLVERGDVGALAAQLQWCAANPAAVAAAGDAARETFGREYGPDASYSRLLDAFASAVSRRAND